MAIIIGRKAKVATSTDDSTYNDLGKVISGTLSITDDIADSTTNDSNGYKEGEYADQQASLDLTMKYDGSNTAQQQLIDEKCTNRSKLYFRIRPEETSGEEQWKFLATLDDISVDFSTGEVEELSITASSSGTITNSTQ